jgi:putative aminopeptidase FrvX
VIQVDRLKALFLELVQIDSLSRREGRIAERLAREMRDLGASVVFDGAHAAIGGEVGNLIARVPWTRARSSCARTWTRSSPASASIP